jgi:hypothetical protein
MKRWYYVMVHSKTFGYNKKFHSAHETPGEARKAASDAAKHDSDGIFYVSESIAVYMLEHITVTEFT